MWNPWCFTVLPVLQLDFGSNINPDDIEENDDVYFECKIHANPQAYKVVWKHNVSIVLTVFSLLCKLDNSSDYSVTMFTQTSLVQFSELNILQNEHYYDVATHISVKPN